jgi:dihydrofolate synthase/folylpolyglutamate synthase
MLDTASLLDGIDADLVNRVLPSLSLAGRSQRLTVDGVEWFFDVAHNPAAASALAMTLASCEVRNTTFAIVGLLDDKDVDGVIAPLTDSVDHWIAVLPNSERAMPSGELARQISNLTARACLVADSVADAIEFARHEALESDRILVTGSFFTVGPILDQLVTESRPEI